MAKKKIAELKAENTEDENIKSKEKKDNKENELVTFDVAKPMIDTYGGEGNDSIITHFHKKFQEYLFQEFSKSVVCLKNIGLYTRPLAKTDTIPISV